MKADKIIGIVLSQTQASFKRKHLWEQAQFLDKVMAQWENLKKVSPRQYHLWSKKFWEMSEWFCIELTDDIEIYKMLPWGAGNNKPPNYPRLLEKLYEFDADRAHQVMMKYPTAFSIVEKEWALWTRIIA